MKLIRPSKLLNSIEGIKAGITLAARDSVNTDGTISGLNLGENTKAPQVEIEHNFETLFKETGFGKDKLARAEQVHGGSVEVVTESGYYHNVDGLVTNKKGLALAIKVADCAAILIADPFTGTIAAVHAGWRGAAAGILPTAIHEMKKLGSDTTNLTVYVSPCLSVQNFEVGEEVAAQFDEVFINRTIGNKPHLNLASLLFQQLMDAGIDKESIELDTLCTVSDNRFYSHRRERNKAGRMLAFIRYER